MKTQTLMKVCIAAIVVVFAAALTFTKIIPYYTFKNYQPQNGDLIFQSLPVNDLVLTIEGVTKSPYSHCGIVVEKDGEWQVLEAIGPVKYTKLYEWVQRGRDEAFTVTRLKDTSKVNEFILDAETFMGKPYDSRYRLDDEKIYCSELIYKAYQSVTGIKLAELAKLGDLPWQEYKRTIEKYEKGSVPLERLMITPVDLSRSTYTSKVYSQNYQLK